MLQADNVLHPQKGGGFMIEMLKNFSFLDYFIVECEGAAFLRHDTVGEKECNGNSNRRGPFIFPTFYYPLLLKKMISW